MKIVCFQYLILVVSLISSVAFASIPKLNLSNELKPEEQTKLEKGEHIVQKKKIDGKIWPEVTIYTLINASPLESVAIFAAYDYQKDYVPNVIKSDPRHVTATEVHVDYEMDMPWPIANGVYTHGHYLKANLKGERKGEYLVEWFMIKSSAADEVKGFAAFYPYKGKTLMKYRSFVDPKSFLAGMLRKIMVKDLIKSVNAIIQTTEKARNEMPSLLTKYKANITDALKGVKVYEK